MGWFKRDPEPGEEAMPEPVRVASDEFLAGLEEVRQGYIRRAKGERGSVLAQAKSLTEKVYFNFGDIDRAVDGIRDAMNRARQFDGLADELSDTINSYKFQGRRPSYMPAPEGDTGGNT